MICVLCACARTCMLVYAHVCARACVRAYARVCLYMRVCADSVESTGALAPDVIVVEALKTLQDRCHSLLSDDLFAELE